MTTSVFKDIRRKGLLVGVAWHPPVADIVDQGREKYLLAHLAEENVMRLLPHLIIDETIEKISKVAGKMT